MHIVLGGTGHVGSAATRALLEHGQPVTIVTRSASKGESWKRAAPKWQSPTSATSMRCGPCSGEEGARSCSIRQPVRRPTPTSRSVRRCAPSSRRSKTPAWRRSWPNPPAARDRGALPSMHPAELKMPMVAPEDLGNVAARLLMEPVDQTGIHHVEGPERYSAADVAAALAKALRRPVKVEETPRERWEEASRGMGFSKPAAQSYARMTTASVDGGFEMPDEPVRGSVSLKDYIGALVQQKGAE